MTQFENSLVLEFPVRFGHRVVARYDFFSECANSGKLVAGAEEAGINGVADLLHQLQVERLAGL